MVFCPPGLLSITTAWPHSFCSRSASSRARLSGPEPGDCDSIHLTGLSGQDSARKALAGSTAAAPSVIEK